MKIGFSSGWNENYWGSWPWTRMYGGSEHILVEVASELAVAGHRVTVRLPYERDDVVYRGVRWVGRSAPVQAFDLLYCFDDFAAHDRASHSVLVACRSDPPPTDHFDELIFLSRHHARLMGHPDRPAVGGGVRLAEYTKPRKRVPGRVICTSSPDRCPAAFEIGRAFPGFVHTYRPVPGMPVTRELTRPELVGLQQSARLHIYPLDPRRPSDFFSMAVLESMAAGTPVIVSDADSMPELWGEVAFVLPQPVRLAEWVEAGEEIMCNRHVWDRLSARGRVHAQQYDWPLVAARYLEVAGYKSP